MWRHVTQVNLQAVASCLLYVEASFSVVLSLHHSQTVAPRLYTLHSTYDNDPPSPLITRISSDQWCMPLCCTAAINASG